MSQGRIIRDVVHSDIFFEKKYFEIIDTAEFQRLNRIKQLSCEYLVFPGATHTRLAHSLGVYFVMDKLIHHFTGVLKDLGYQVTEEEKELALCAALVHDLGHGPFSHSFENIFPVKSHESWTTEILQEESTEIHQVIIKNFGKEFLDALVDLISKEYAGHRQGGILSIISTLVSSQVDADRMDYLLRDAYFTSVTNGNFDLNRLIRSLGVEQSPRDSFIIYIHEKFMATLEEYILARYYMHKEVYQHSVKRQMEGILKKIFLRAGELIGRGSQLYCHPVIDKLIHKKDIGVKEYLRIDDNTLIYHLELWEKSQDPILAFLCRCFLDRNKFEKRVFSTEDKESVEKFKESINKVLKNGNKYPIKDFSKEYFIFEDEMKLELYANRRENIWIKSSRGELHDLSQRSTLINKKSMTDQTHSQRRIYYSRELFQMIYGQKWK